ncbi:unnamed protein product [Leptosia nina]|uniref:Protein CNPPD1 n=1 Tax=Leptosia nina TaxID=320188 RepID=A0AAV1JWN6_9NEOP
MSSISKRKKEFTKTKMKGMGNHQEFLKRISKTLYYGQLPTLPCLSLPVTEISCEVWSMAQRGRSIQRLHTDQAATIARSACVSPCALVLAILYLERLKRCNPDYLTTTPPVDLFLVSLMISNKFLQDDGEDDEVIGSEWAASGGLELPQLNKLEADFLNAIEWNIFVSEKTFEAGLSWLERQVAIKQAQMRGFFTYSDLIISYDPTLLKELLKSVSSACFALTFGYVTSFITLVTSTLVMSSVWVPALEYIMMRGCHSTVIHTHAMSTSKDLQQEQANTSLYNSADLTLEFSVNLENIKCCENWQRYQDHSENSHRAKKSWYNGVIENDLKLFQTWWSKTSVLNWLYQSSLINPMQRWLDKVKEYVDFTSGQLKNQISNGQCHRDRRAHCLQQKVNISKLTVFAVSMSDQ